MHKTFVAAAMVAVGCSNGAAGRGQKPPEQAKVGEAQAPTRASALTIDRIPQGARDALASQAPSFVPWSADAYMPSDRDSTRTSSDGGLCLVRAKFRTPSSVDYAIAGYDRRLHGLRIVAILAEPTGTYKVMSISEGPERTDSLAATPDKYLSVDSTSVAGRIDLLVIPIKVGAPVNTERYTWVAARGQFLVVTPN